MWLETLKTTDYNKTNMVTISLSAVFVFDGKTYTLNILFFSLTIMNKYTYTLPVQAVCNSPSLFAFQSSQIPPSAENVPIHEFSVEHI